MASDAVQEAFVRLWEQPPRNAEARAWLFRVATNVVRERARAGARHARLLDGAPSGALHGDPPSAPDARVQSLEDIARVRRALDALGERDRSALLLREEGFSHAEIADAVGTTTRSVGTILARALVKLAAALQSGGRS